MIATEWQAGFLAASWAVCLLAMVRFAWRVTVCTSILLAGCPEPTPRGVETPPEEEKFTGRVQDGTQDPGQEGKPFVAEPISFSGFSLKLSDAPVAEVVKKKPEVAEAQPLSEAEVAELLEQLPEMEQAEAREFAFRKDSLKRPKAGRDVKTPFPPKVKRPRPMSSVMKVKKEALRITRFSPEGTEIQHIPRVSVTFSAPMVPLSSLEEVHQKKIPVTITPLRKGEWRWLDTQTLQFIPKQPLPKATRYTVRVKRGTRSTLGNVLAKDFSFWFETVRNQLSSTAPGNNQNGLNPTITLSFTQPLTRKDALRLTTVRTGGQVYLARMAKKQPQEIDKTTGGVSRVALELTRPLPKNVKVSITVAAKIPSVYGPLLSTRGGQGSFRTYPPFEVHETSCSSYRCRPHPNTSFRMSLTNPIDATIHTQKILSDQIQVTPALDGLRIDASGSQVSVTGNPTPNTTYRVTLPASLSDTWKQRISGKRRHSFETTELPPPPAPAPWLSPTRGRMLVLDPDGPRTYEVKTKNHPTLSVSLYRVTPTDWYKYQEEFVQRYFHYKETIRETAAMPGELAEQRSIKVDTPEKETKIEIDLSPALRAGLGQMVLLIEGADHNRSHVAWIQATQIGITVFVDQHELSAFVSQLGGGLPIRGARGQFFTRGGASISSALADRSGIIQTAFLKSAQLISVTKDGDVAFLPAHLFGGEEQKEQRQLLWYVIDDRKLYRPNETARFKGWIRVLDHKKRGDLSLPRSVTQVTYRVVDQQHNEINKGELKLSKLGGFDLEVELPDNINLGQASLILKAETTDELSAKEHYHRFKVEEFRRPEFEVEIVPDEPYLMSKEIIIPVRARYYSGGPLPFAETSWHVNSSQSTFVPPNRSNYKFGRSPPVWCRYCGYRSINRGFEEPVYRTHGKRRRPSYHGILDLGRPTKNKNTLSSKTGRNGVHRLKVEIEGKLPPWPISLALESSVMDVNRQKWVANANVQVHPSEAYLGLRAPHGFVGVNDPIFIDTIVSDFAGKAKKDHMVDVRAFSLANEKEESGGWKRVMKETQKCQFSSLEGPTRCVFRAKRGGTFLVRGIVRDAQEKILSATEIGVYVAGPQPPDQDQQLRQQKVFLLADKKSYVPDDVARILVQSPFTPAQGILTVRRSGLIERRRFTMEETAQVVQLNIEDEHIPGLKVQIDLFGEVPRTDAKGEIDKTLPARPAYAGGQLDLEVTPDTRELRLTATPAVKAIEPGEKTTITVAVEDRDGRPVSGAEVALLAADESVLALAGYELPDPLQTFFPKRGTQTRTIDSRQHLVLSGKPKPKKPSDPQPVEAPEEAFGAAFDDEGGPGRGGGGQGAGIGMAESSKRRSKSAASVAGKGLLNVLAGKTGKKSVKMRKSFGALLVFKPELATDSSGKTTVEVELPDTLTRYRIMAVAVDGAKRFGKGESTLRARKELMIRPSPPRFLNFGDRAELPVLVQNLKETKTTVKLALRVRNLELTGAKGLLVEVPQENRVEVRFPITTKEPGRALVQLIAESGALSDAAQIKLPVWSPATSESFAVYGTIDEGAMMQRVQAPKDAAVSFGGLEITTSATALAELTDAFLYLISYPYDCSEQISSRLLGIVSLKDVLSAFDAPGLPDQEELMAFLASDVKELQKRQNGDGGWDYWRHDSVPYVSIHAAHALVRAKKKGIEVNAKVFDNAQRYLARIDEQIARYESRHRIKYDLRTRNALVAYALYVRSLGGQSDPTRAAKMVRTVGLKKLSLETAGWLLSVLAGQQGFDQDLAQLKRFLNNRVEETAARASFVTSYGRSSHWILASDRRTDAVILDGLIRADKDNTLIPKIVRGLLAHRLKGRWRNTQENVFILVALEHYFSTFESVTPDFVARVWLGEDYAGEQAYRGRTTDRQHLQIPMALIKSGEASKELLLQKDGAGRLYYRIGLKYAPLSLQLDPLDRGFAVSRKYEAVESPDDVQREKDGSWRIRAGATVRVTLTMQAPSQRYHVALVDKLPAGLEPLNPALAGTTTQQSKQSIHGYNWWSQHWFQHQNLRDERAEAFTSSLYPGRFTYTYMARATTPGRFIVPPAKAEEMYTPETFGRSGSEVVVVLP